MKGVVPLAMKGTKLRARRGRRRVQKVVARANGGGMATMNATSECMGFSRCHREERELLELDKDLKQPDGTALALSGGGIRSASFALGVAQALSAKGLLTRFHYLS